MPETLAESDATPGASFTPDAAHQIKQIREDLAEAAPAAAATSGAEAPEIAQPAEENTYQTTGGFF